jgi:hypothetical protein
VKTYIITLFAGEEEYYNEQVEIECENLEQDGTFEVIVDNGAKIVFERGIEKISIRQ